jgi:hypothetical protein
LRDLEATVDQQLKLLAAYGSETDAVTSHDEALTTATRAIDRAGVVVEYLDGDKSRAATELRSLHAAVAPLVEVTRTARNG